MLYRFHYAYGQRTSESRLANKALFRASQRVILNRRKRGRRSRNARPLHEWRKGMMEASRFSPLSHRVGRNTNRSSAIGNEIIIYSFSSLLRCFSWSRENVSLLSLLCSLRREQSNQRSHHHADKNDHPCRSKEARGEAGLARHRPEDRDIEE
jgi:hypothetical protein